MRVSIAGPGAAQWMQARCERDERLAASDAAFMIALENNAMAQIGTPQERMAARARLEALIAYRRALRDIPQQRVRPSAIEWPEPPPGVPTKRGAK